MDIPGRKMRLPRWIHTDACVVKVEVEAIIPDAEPSEPCFGPEAVRFLKDVYQHAQAGDLPWLERVGTVYIRQSA